MTAHFWLFRYNFKLHWKTHEGEKSYKCDECDYAACSQRHLESHILTHSGEKPFECDECDHAFRQKQLLKRHKNHHHTSDYHPPTPKDKNHDCGSCEKSFAHKGNLMRHMVQHGGEDYSEDDTTSAASGEGGCCFLNSSCLFCFPLSKFASPLKKMCWSDGFNFIYFERFVL